MSNLHHDDHSHDSHDHGHHKETFISKYVFSMDHKMIAKQFLITGIIMGTLGMAMSLLFRLQLAYPDMKLPFLENVIGNGDKMEN
jgi:cytochrome c oxidase subunit 1